MKLLTNGTEVFKTMNQQYLRKEAYASFCLTSALPGLILSVEPLKTRNLTILLLFSVRP
jgi:hypothetical protein